MKKFLMKIGLIMLALIILIVGSLIYRRISDKINSVDFTFLGINYIYEEVVIDNG